MIKRALLILKLLFILTIGGALLLTSDFAVAHSTAHTPKPKPKPQPQPADPCEGMGECCDPGPKSPGSIVFRSGNETFTRTDMTVKGIYPISLSRTYSSQSQYDSPLGYGWAFNFDARLFEYPDNSVIIRTGCGVTERFIYTGGSYQADVASRNNRLVKNTDNGYSLYYQSGTVRVFDSQGRLTQNIDVSGNALEYTYDPRGKLPVTGTSPYTFDPSKPITVSYIERLTRIQEHLVDGSLGNSIDLTYNETTGRLISAVANDGRSVSYIHDVTSGGLTKGNLVQVNGLEGKVSLYEYNDTVAGVYQDHHNITRMQEGVDGTPGILSYDSEDRAYQEVLGNDTWQIDYSQYLFQSTVTHTLRNTANTIIKTETTVYRYDGNGYVNSKTDGEGNETLYGSVSDSDRGSHGETEREEIYQGTAATGTLVKVINRTYNTRSQVLTESTSPTIGETIATTWTYDDDLKASEETVSSLNILKRFRREWIYNHNAQGKPTTVQEERNYKNDGTYLVTSYTYNSKGQLLTTTLPDGHVIVNEYGPAYNGRYVTRTYHLIAGAPVTDLQQIYTYDAYGNRNSVTDAKNHTTTTEYDTLNRRTKVTNHLGHVISYAYDDRDNITRITKDRSTANDQLDITELTYDGQNRLVTVKRADAGGALVTIKQNTYDSHGNLLSTTNSLNQTTSFVYDNNNRQKKITNYKNESITYTLDVLGNRTAEEIRNSSNVIVQQSSATFDVLKRQLTQVGGTHNQTTIYTYDAAGNRVTMTDALSRPATQYTYNTLSQLTNIKDADGQDTQYGYHDRGWLATVTDPRNLITHYNYNELGQLQNLQSPDTGTTAFTYDLAGNKHTKTDARGIVATYGYDNLNRLTGITYADSTQNVSFTYDQGTNGLGKLTHMTDTSGSSHYEYNAWGDLAKETKVINGRSLVISYSYDTEHRLRSITYPSGRVISYNTDANQDINQIASLYQSSNQTLADLITYQPFGGVDTYTYGNGLAHNNDYDLDYRLTNQQAGSVYQRGYDWNDVNNITAITNVLDATRNQTFDYDNLNRLTDASGIYGARHYGYDADGNRILETVSGTQTTNYTYATGNNYLQNLSGTVSKLLGYDNNGNTTADGSITFQYNAHNRMQQATNGATTATYTYDGKGQRVVKQIGATSTLFIYDKSGKLIAEADASGNSQKEYVWLGMQPIAQVKYGTNAGIYYYHSDQLNTPQLMTAQNQSVVWNADYEPFGEVAIVTNTIENNLRFPGQYYDSETGNHYNYFRDYSAEKGRYLESDPIGLNGGLNTFTYVKNNPVNQNDPLGLISPLGAACMVADAALIAITAKALADLMKKINDINDKIKAIESQCPLNDEARLHNMEKIAELKHEQVQLMLNEGAAIAGAGFVEIAIMIGCAAI